MSHWALVSVVVSAVGRLGHVSLPLLGAGLAFQSLGLVLRGAAWRNILAGAHADRKVPLGAIVGGYVAGVAANGVLPAKGGELIKVAVARRTIPHSATPAIVASLGVLSLFDAIMGFAIALVLISTGTIPGVHPTQLLPGIDPRVIALAVAACVAGALLAVRFSGVYGRARAALVSAKASLAILRTPGRYLRTVAVLQLAAWACRISVAAVLLAAFGLRPSLASAATVVVLGGLTGLVPGSPGGIGAQQVVLVYVLGSTAASAHVLAFSVGMQLSVMVFQAVLGVAAVMVLMRAVNPLHAARALRGSLSHATG